MRGKLRRLALAVLTLLGGAGLAILPAAAPAQAAVFTNTACFNINNPPSYLPSLPSGSGFYVTRVGFVPACSYIGFTDQWGNNGIFYIREEYEGITDNRGAFTPVEVCYSLTAAVTGSSAPRAGWGYSAPYGLPDCYLNHVPGGQNAARLICNACPRISRVANAAGLGASAVAAQSGTDPTSRGRANGLSPEISAIVEGTGLSQTTVTATTGCQTTLADRRLEVRAHNNIVVFACLTEVSPTKIKFYLPPTTPILGYDRELTGSVRLLSGGGTDLLVNGRRQGFAVPLRKFAPGLYSASGDGVGLPSGYIVRERPDGSSVTEALSTTSSIKLGNDRVSLILYATGIRFADPTRLTLRMGGSCNQSTCGGGGPFVGINWFGPAPGYGAQGVDQLNVELPKTNDAVGSDVLIWLSANESAQAPEVGRWSNVLRLWIEL